MRKILRARKHAVILGAGGLGKTSLALNVYENVPPSLFASKMSVACETLTTATALSDQLLLQLLPNDKVPSRTTKESHQAIRAELGRSPRTLLYLDNLETTSGAQPDETVDLVNVLSAISTVTLLITTRDKTFLKHASLSLDRFGSTLVLANLASSHTQALYLKRSAGKHADDDDLDELIARLDGHPLTIVLVAAQADCMGSIAQFLELWESEYAALVSAPADGTHRNCLRVSLSLSLKSLDRRSASRAQALDLLWFLARLPDGIAISRLRALGGPHFPWRAWRVERTFPLPGPRSTADLLGPDRQDLVDLSLVVQTPEENLRLLVPISQLVRTSALGIERPALDVRLALYESVLATFRATPIKRSASPAQQADSDDSSLPLIVSMAIDDAANVGDPKFEQRIGDAILLKVVRGDNSQVVTPECYSVPFTPSSFRFLVKI